MRWARSFRRRDIRVGLVVAPICRMTARSYPPDLGQSQIGFPGATAILKGLRGKLASGSRAPVDNCPSRAPPSYFRHGARKSLLSRLWRSSDQAREAVRVRLAAMRGGGLSAPRRTRLGVFARLGELGLELGQTATQPLLVHPRLGRHRFHRIEFLAAHEFHAGQQTRELLADPPSRSPGASNSCPPAHSPPLWRGHRGTDFGFAREGSCCRRSGSWRRRCYTARAQNKPVWTGPEAEASEQFRPSEWHCRGPAKVRIRIRGPVS